MCNCVEKLIEKLENKKNELLNKKVKFPIAAKKKTEQAAEIQKTINLIKELWK